jgi:hypothetical protein
MPLPDDVRTRLVMLEQAATPGEWWVGPGPFFPIIMYDNGDATPLRESWFGRDAALLAALRNAAPTLLASDAWAGKALMFLRQLSDNGIAQTSVIKGARALLREAEDAPQATEG